MIQTGWQAKALASTACLRDAGPSAERTTTRIRTERGYVEKGDNRTYSLSMHVGYRGNRTKRVSEIAAKKGIRLVNGEKE